MDHLEEIDERIAAERRRLEGIEQVSVESSGLAEALAALLGPDAHPEAAVRRAVLLRADLPLEALVAAASDPDPGVRGFAVGLAQAPAEAVAAAVSDPAWQVRAEVARRTDCTPEILARLVRDRDPIVRRAALAHRSVPVDVVVQVLLDGTSRLDAEFAAGHPGIRFGRHRAALVRANRFGALGLLAQSGLPSELTARFAELDHASDVRAKAVQHPHCPPATLAAAVTADPDASVRAEAAQRTDCPPAALVTGAVDVDSRVRLACAGNDACPAEAVDRLLTDDDDAIRRRAAGRPEASQGALARVVAHDESMVVRKAAVGNPVCPPATVTAACSDPALVFKAAANPSCGPDGFLAAIITIKRMQRESPKGVAANDPEEKGRARVREVATLARKALRKQRWEWLAAQPIELMRADDLEFVLRGKLRQARTDCRDAVRVAVASHPDADEATLIELASDPCPAVRAAASARVLAAALGQ